MHETRVNLKHLLEDIRDSYPLSLNEVIIVELIANSLDSRASRIDFVVNPLEQTVTIVDNGQGMRRAALKDYHNIAASTKVRGTSIGFAGIGAKLSLLIATSVVTETKGGRGSQAATTWHLASDNRAPWQYLPAPGLVTTPRGTAVTIAITDPTSPLLSPEFIHQTIVSHFAPLFIPEFFAAIYRYLYQQGIIFTVNGQPVERATPLLPDLAKIFRIHLGRQTKRLAGFGYLTRSNEEAGPTAGLSIATYGKVIKTGWEWLGLEVSAADRLVGFVEIPALAHILIINKMDFLRDAASLKKYYAFRKAIQAAVRPILEELGSQSTPIDRARTLRPLTRQIEQALRPILGHFPELLPLLGVRPTTNPARALRALAHQPLLSLVAERTEPAPTATKIPATPRQSRSGTKKRTKAPALAIGFEAVAKTDPMARMIENSILVNTNHPAYQKAVRQHVDGYHTVMCVAWSLAHFLEEGRSPHGFINDFLTSWGRQDAETGQLFD